MIYFDSDMSKSTNTVVYFDWKTVTYIYACGKCRTQFMVWPPQAILVSDWSISKKIISSETAWPNGSKLGRKHLCKILYKTSSFNSIRPTNMAAVTKNRTYGKIARFW